MKRGSSLPTFSNPGMVNSSNPSQPGFSCTPLSDQLEGHHHLQPANNWQQDPETPFSFGGDHDDNRRLLPTFFSGGMDSYSNAQFPNMGAPAWDSRGSYASVASNAIAGNMPSNMGHEQVHVVPADMNAGLDYINPELSHIQTGHAHIHAEASFRRMATLPQSSPELDKFFSRSSWCANATMDPLSGCITMQGLNFAASNCLANLPTDPGFTDRAARFSLFGNMGYPDCHLDGDRTRVSGKAYQNKTTVLCTIQKESAPSSPVGADNVDGSNDVHEAYRFSAKDRLSTDLPTDNSNVGMERKASFSPVSNMALEGNEGVPKQFHTSANESDESMGQEVSSSYEKSLGNEASPVRGLTGNSGRKRKAGPQKLKGGGANKDPDPDGSTLKCQQSGDHEPKQSNSGNSEASTPKSAPESSKPPEPPKQDFIHVRARRGQATDSHSLAERVRREKISERMKFLQDLVPGCSKVTGKAVMLDEIINYVQSLQRQVEFLSMKLAAVNPRVDFSIDNLFGRERVQPRDPVFSLDNANMYPPLHPHQQSHMPMQGQCPPLDVQSFGSDPTLRRTMSTPPSVDTFCNPVAQVPQAWDEELQSVVQMTFAGPAGGSGQPSLDLQGQMFPGQQMKAEH